MDYYLNPDNVANRLLQEYRKHGTLTVAFDFDDTVYDFHQKGRMYANVIDLLIRLHEIGCYLICWTGQENEGFVCAYLAEHNIPFDAINQNPPFYNSTSRKIYANAYLDDRAGLKQVYDELCQLVNTVKGQTETKLIDTT